MLVSIVGRARIRNRCRCLRSVDGEVVRQSQAACKFVVRRIRQLERERVVTCIDALIDNRAREGFRFGDFRLESFVARQYGKFVRAVVIDSLRCACNRLNVGFRDLFACYCEGYGVYVILPYVVIRREREDDRIVACVRHADRIVVYRSVCASYGEVYAFFRRSRNNLCVFIINKIFCTAERRRNCLRRDREVEEIVQLRVVSAFVTDESYSVTTCVGRRSSDQFGFYAALHFVILRLIRTEEHFAILGICRIGASVVNAAADCGFLAVFPTVGCTCDCDLLREDRALNRNGRIRRCPEVILERGIEERDRDGVFTCILNRITRYGILRPFRQPIDGIAYRDRDGISDFTTRINVAIKRNRRRYSRFSNVHGDDAFRLIIVAIPEEGYLAFIRLCIGERCIRCMGPIPSPVSRVADLFPQSEQVRADRYVFDRCRRRCLFDGDRNGRGRALIVRGFAQRYRNRIRTCIRRQAALRLFCRICKLILITDLCRFIVRNADIPFRKGKCSSVVSLTAIVRNRKRRRCLIDRYFYRNDAYRIEVDRIVAGQRTLCFEIVLICAIADRGFRRYVVAPCPSTHLVAIKLADGKEELFFHLIAVRCRLHLVLRYGERRFGNCIGIRCVQAAYRGTRAAPCIVFVGQLECYGVVICNVRAVFIRPSVNGIIIRSGNFRFLHATVIFEGRLRKGRKRNCLFRNDNGYFHARSACIVACIFRLGRIFCRIRMRSCVANQRIVAGFPTPFAVRIVVIGQSLTATILRHAQRFAVRCFHFRNGLFIFHLLHGDRDGGRCRSEMLAFRKVDRYRINTCVLNRRYRFGFCRLVRFVRNYVSDFIDVRSVIYSVLTRYGYAYQSAQRFRRIRNVFVVCKRLITCRDGARNLIYGDCEFTRYCIVVINLIRCRVVFRLACGQFRRRHIPIIVFIQIDRRQRNSAEPSNLIRLREEFCLLRIREIGVGNFERLYLIRRRIIFRSGNIRSDIICSDGCHLDLIKRNRVLAVESICTRRIIAIGNIRKRTERCRCNGRVFCRVVFQILPAINAQARNLVGCLFDLVFSFIDVAVRAAPYVVGRVVQGDSYLIRTNVDAVSVQVFHRVAYAANRTVFIAAVDGRNLRLPRILGAVACAEADVGSRYLRLVDGEGHLCRQPCPVGRLRKYDGCNVSACLRIRRQFVIRIIIHRTRRRIRIRDYDRARSELRGSENLVATLVFIRP